MGIVICIYDARVPSFNSSWVPGRNGYEWDVDVCGMVFIVDEKTNF